MASYQLCKDDGSLLMNRGKLLSLAREKVHNDGYNYSKKSSRSRVFGSHEEKEKRQYVRGEVREARMIELTENISSQEEAIKFLQQQKTKYSNTDKFLEAAEITKSIQEENTKKRKLELELQKLKSKEARSTEYRLKSKKRKSVPRKEKYSSVSTEVDISSDNEFVRKLIRTDSVPQKVLEEMIKGTGSNFNSSTTLDSVSQQDIANQTLADVVESCESQVNPPSLSNFSALPREDKTDEPPFLV